MQSLAYAKEVVFIDSPGSFEEPPASRGKIHYVGPLVRDFTYTRHDRDRARRELGLPVDARILLVLPGRWFTEERAPIFGEVLTAFLALKCENKRLIWFAGSDYRTLAKRQCEIDGLIVKEVDWRIDRWMVACDLAVTKATRKTAMELESLGVPSISLSHGRNVIDDLRAKRIPTNTHLNIRDLKAGELTAVMERVLAVPPTLSPRRAAGFDGLRRAARRLSINIRLASESQPAARWRDEKRP